jgi:hypothetical protein
MMGTNYSHGGNNEKPISEGGADMVILFEKRFVVKAG